MPNSGMSARSGTPGRRTPSFGTSGSDALLFRPELFINVSDPDDGANGAAPPNRHALTLAIAGYIDGPDRAFLFLESPAPSSRATTAAAVPSDALLETPGKVQATIPFFRSLTIE